MQLESCQTARNLAYLSRIAPLTRKLPAENGSTMGGMRQWVQRPRTLVMVTETLTGD